MRSDQQIHHSKTNRRYVVYPLVGGISLLLLLPPYSMGDHCFSFTSTPSEDSHSTQHQDTGGALSPQPQTQPLRSAQNPLKNSAHNGNAKVGNGARNGNPAQILIKNSAQNGNAETGNGARKGKTTQNRPARKPNENSAPTGNAQKGNVTESPKAHSFSICSLLGPTMAILIILLFATFVLAITGAKTIETNPPPKTSSDTREECVCMIKRGQIRVTQINLNKSPDAWDDKQPIRTRYLGHVTYPIISSKLTQSEVILVDEEKEILGEETEPVDSKKDQTNKYTIPKLTEDLSDLLHYLSNQEPPLIGKQKRIKDRKKAQIKQKRKLLSEKKKGQSSKTNPGNIDMGDLTNSSNGYTAVYDKTAERKLQGDSTTAAKVPETAPRAGIMIHKNISTGEAGTGVQLKHVFLLNYYSSATSPPPPMRFISSRQVEEGVELSLTDGDTVTILLKLGNKASILSSIYMGRGMECPPPKFKEIVDYAKINNHALVLGSDVNAHSTAWGSVRFDPEGTTRGEALLDKIIQEDLHISNVNNAITFDNGRWENVIDLTITNNSAVKGLPEWEVVKGTCRTDRVKITIVIVGPGMNHGMGEMGLKDLLLSLNGEKPGPGGYPDLSGAMRLLTEMEKLKGLYSQLSGLARLEEFYKGVTARGLVTHELMIRILIPGDVP
eukprot:sb/3479430/